MTKDDPVVERVRAARRKIMEECGNDMHKLFEWAKQVEAQYKDRVVGYERSKRPPRPDNN